MNPVLRNSARSPRSLLFETIFGDDFINFGNQLVDDYSVKTNVSSTDEEYKVDVIAPGLDRDDLGVKVENNHLYVTYNSENNTNTTVQYKSFSRFWKLPTDADYDTIRAEYKQGILSVFVPRETPASNSIDIDIK
jgi:HSP20 family molecular chaperone IbpA